MNQPIEISLLALWRILHTRLMLMAQGATASYQASTGHHKQESKPPARVDRDVWKLEDAWKACKTNMDRRRVLADALDLLALYAPKAKPDTNPGTLEWKQAIADDPRPSRVVAKMYGVSHATVCEYRVKFGQRLSA